jgi:toxin CptA
LAIAMSVLGLLALWSLWLSALPMSVVSILAMLVVIYSAVVIRRELRRESFTLIWAGGDESAILNFADRTQPLSGPKLSIRGPLAGVRGKDDAGRSRLYLWWPDTLSSTARRQLRLVDQTRKEPQTLTSAK